MSFLHSPQLKNKRVHIFFKITVKLFVLGFVSRKLNIYSNTRRSLLLHVINMLGYFMDLRHHDNLFNNFFHQMRNLHDSIARVTNWHKSILHGVNLLVLGLDLVVDISHSDNSIFLNNNILVEEDLLNLLDNFTLFDYFFFNSWYLNYLLLNSISVNNLVNEFIDDLVACDEHWLFGSYLNKFGNFYSLLDNFLDLVDLGHFIVHLNYLVMIDWDLHELFFNRCCHYWLFFDYLYFSKFLCDIRHNLLNLSYFFLNYNFLLQSGYLLDCRHLFDALYYLFHLLRNFFYFLNLFLNHN